MHVSFFTWLIRLKSSSRSDKATVPLIAVISFFKKKIPILCALLLRNFCCYSLACTNKTKLKFSLVLCFN